MASLYEFVKNPIIEGVKSVRFRTNGQVVAYTNQYGLVGSVYNADMAEAFKYDPEYVKELPEEGTVMVLNPDNGLVMPSHNDLDNGKYYVGIVRYHPGIFLGNQITDWEKLFQNGYLPLALIGQVTVLVDPNFEYKIGTKLMSYVRGRAKPAIYLQDEWFGKVIQVVEEGKIKALIK